MSRGSQQLRVALMAGMGLVLGAVAGCTPGTPAPPTSSDDEPWYSWALDEEDHELMDDAALVSQGQEVEPIEVTAHESYMLLVDRDHYDAVDAKRCGASQESAVSSVESLPQSTLNMPWGSHAYFSVGAFTAQETTSVTIDCDAPEATIISIADPT